MEGVMPISLSINRATPAVAGSSAGPGPLIPLLSNLLTQLDSKIERLANLFQPLFVNLVDLLEGYRGTSLRVYETNPEMLDHIQQTRWILAQFLYNHWGDFVNLVRGIRHRLGQLRGDLAGIGYELTSFGNAVTSLLRAILEQMRRGVTLDGNVTLTVRQPDLVPFVQALHNLAFMLAKLKWADVKFSLVPGLDALTRFVTALGFALSKVTPEVAAALPNLVELVRILGSLAYMLAKLPAKDVFWMNRALAGLSKFVETLGNALGKLNAGVLNALPKLTQFIVMLGGLALVLAGMPWKDTVSMFFGLGIIAGFVWLLSYSLSQLNEKIVGSLDKFAAFIEKLKDLSKEIIKWQNWDFVRAFVGFAIIAGFVYVLVLALNQLSEGAVKAMPEFAKLMGSLAALAKTLSELSWGKLAIVALGFVVMAGFVWALALAAKWAGPELKALATVLGAIEKALTAIAGAASGAYNKIKGLGQSISNSIGLGGQPGGATPPANAPAAAGLVPPAPPAPAGLPLTPPPAPAGQPLVPITSASPAAAGLPGASPMPGSDALSKLLGGGTPGAPASVDQSVNVNGGINLTINADKLEADASKILTDKFISMVQAKLRELRSDQDFRTGVRASNGGR